MKEMNESNKSTELLEIVLAKQKELYTKKREEIKTREKEITEDIVEHWEKVFEKYIIPNLANFNNDGISIECIDITTHKKTPRYAEISFRTAYDCETILTLEIQDFELATYINSNTTYRIEKDFKGIKYAPYFDFSADKLYTSTTCSISL